MVSKAQYHKFFECLPWKSVLSLILLPTFGRDSEGFCLITIKRVYLNIGKRNRSNTLFQGRELKFMNHLI
jgi:hypothetical protein